MDSGRKVWQRPTLNEISVHDVLAKGPAGNLSLGPPGWASPGPLITGGDTLMGPPDNAHFGPFSHQPNPVAMTSSDGPPVDSDVRLKEDISVVGTTKHGLPLYTFRYRGRAGVYEGVMAQDVIDVRPDAVLMGPNGFYQVDYGKLGVEFRRID